MLDRIDFLMGVVSVQMSICLEVSQLLGAQTTKGLPLVR